MSETKVYTCTSGHTFSTNPANGCPVCEAAKNRRAFGLSYGRLPRLKDARFSGHKEAE